jgi:hypothetical protein
MNGRYISDGAAPGNKASTSRSGWPRPTRVARRPTPPRRERRTPRKFRRKQ